MLVPEVAYFEFRHMTPFMSRLELRHVMLKEGRRSAYIGNRTLYLSLGVEHPHHWDSILPPLDVLSSP